MLYLHVFLSVIGATHGVTECAFTVCQYISGVFTFSVYSRGYKSNHIIIRYPLYFQRENQQKLRQIGQELSNVDASANRLQSLEGELQRAVRDHLDSLICLNIV